MKRRSHGDGCCETPKQHGHHHGGHGMHDSHGCCCGGGSRHFVTAKERLAALEEYRKQAELELEGVSEAIKELKARMK